MRIVTWNVRYFSHAVGGITSMDITIRRIADALAELTPQADIICLQEIDDLSIRGVGGRSRGRRRRGESISNFDRFVSRLNAASLERGGHLYQAQFFPAQGHSSDLPLYSTGLAILYQSSLTRVDHNGGEPHDITHRRLRRFARFKQKRICAWTRLATLDHKHLDVFNTHLSLPAFLKPGKGPTGRRFGEADNQVLEVDKVLEVIASHGDPDRSLLLGDFNALPGSRVYNRVTEHFVDAHAAYLGIPPNELQKFSTGGFWRFKYRLDHVFRGRNIDVEDFDGTIPLNKQHPWRHLSDHSPMFATITIR